MNQPYCGNTFKPLFCQFQDIRERTQRIDFVEKLRSWF